MRRSIELSIISLSIQAAGLDAEDSKNSLKNARLPNVRRHVIRNDVTDGLKVKRENQILAVERIRPLVVCRSRLQSQGSSRSSLVLHRYSAADHSLHFAYPSRYGANSVSFLDWSRRNGPERDGLAPTHISDSAV